MELPRPGVYDLEPVPNGEKALPVRKDPLDAAQIARRLRLVAAVLGVVGLGLAIQLARWQVVEPKPSSEALVAARLPLRLRGTIVDRDGYPLALDIVVWNVLASPREVPEGAEETIAAELGRLTGVAPERIARKLADKGANWAVLALGQDEKVRKQIAEQIEKGELPGIYLEPTARRVNPEGASTAQLVGIVSLSERREAFYGVEGYFNEFLSGADRAVGLSDVSSMVQLPPAAQRFIPSSAKRDLVLTIDRDIQSMVVEELQYGIQESGAQGGTVIVMEPATGAVLAMFSLPTFEPVKFPEYARYESHESILRDPGVSESFEPGSIFKIVTMAAGLDAGVIQPETTYVDAGCEEYGQRKICNSGNRAAGLVDMWEVLPQSLNLGAAFVSNRLGPEQFYRYVWKFGFGRVTEVDLQSEVPGNVRRPGDPLWSKADLATHSFGQGLSVTPIQMVTAVAAVANRGMLMKPHVVSKVVLGDRMVEIKPVVVQQVISPETARIVTEMMVKAIQRGANQAAVSGYTVAGKTGTAQIPVEGGYDPRATIASFVGFAPADAPRFVILVKVDRPAGSEGWGMYVAAPIFRRIAERLFVYLGIPPDATRRALQAAHQEVPQGYPQGRGEG